MAGMVPDYYLPLVQAPKTKTTNATPSEKVAVSADLSTPAEEECVH